MEKIIPILVGPTAVGKTGLSILISKQLPVEIISADSRQIYKKLDIGTAKPDPSIITQVPHHFIDILDPSEYFSSGRFSKLARNTINEIIQRNKIPLIVGGSGLYIKSLVDGIFELEIQDDNIRSSLQKRINSEGPESLYKELKIADPEFASRISPNDRQRIIRGLEVFLITGKKLSALQEEKTAEADFSPLFFGLTLERKKLYDRINKRVDEMLDNGLLVEVLHLKNSGYHTAMNAINTVGYKEVFSYLDNEISYDKMVDLIKRNTRRYAKRQYTWFNKEKRIRWYELKASNSLEDIAEKICAELKRNIYRD